MTLKKDITAIILAGGNSKRMGKDKGFILWKSKPFISHVINAVKPLVDYVIIVSDNPAYDSIGHYRIRDGFSNKGPLSGLYSGLIFSQTSKNIVLSCDVPLVTTDVLSLLSKEKNNHVDVTLFKIDGKQMPLVALYNKKNCVAKCKYLISQNQLKMTRLIKQLNIKEIELEASQKRLLANINTPEDLKILEE